MKHLLDLWMCRTPSRPQAGFQFLQESTAYSALLAAWDEGSTPPSFAEFLAQQRRATDPAPRIQAAVPGTRPATGGQHKQMKQNPARREAELIPDLPTLAPSAIHP